MAETTLIVINDQELKSKPYVVAVPELESIINLGRFSSLDYDYYIDLGKNNKEKIKVKSARDIVYLLIEGRSYFENQEQFYNEVASKLFKWSSEGKGIIIILKLDILNSSSRKHLKDIILKTAKKTEELNVFWISIDEEMFSEGVEMNDILGEPDYFIY